MEGVNLVRSKNYNPKWMMYIGTGLSILAMLFYYFVVESGIFSLDENLIQYFWIGLMFFIGLGFGFSRWYQNYINNKIMETGMSIEAKYLDIEIPYNQPRGANILIVVKAEYMDSMKNERFVFNLYLLDQKKIKFFAGFVNKKSSKGIYEKLFIGKTFKVFINPENPKQYAFADGWRELINNK